MREKIWTLTSAFLDGGPIAFFLFWLIIGAFNLPQDGKTLMLFRIGPAYYIGHPLSLVCFSLLYFLLRYGYGYLKTLSMPSRSLWDVGARRPVLVHNEIHRRERSPDDLSCDLRPLVVKAKYKLAVCMVRHLFPGGLRHNRSAIPRRWELGVRSRDYAARL